MFETRPGMTHSSEICTEHRNTIQWYNMFYNIIILDIVRLLLFLIICGGGCGVSLDILFKCCYSTLRQYLLGEEGVEP